MTDACHCATSESCRCCSILCVCRLCDAMVHASTLSWRARVDRLCRPCWRAYMYAGQSGACGERAPARKIGVNCGVCEALRLSPLSSSESRRCGSRDGADSVRSGHLHPGAALLSYSCLRLQARQEPQSQIPLALNVNSSSAREAASSTTSDHHRQHAEGSQAAIGLGHRAQCRPRTSLHPTTDTHSEDERFANTTTSSILTKTRYIESHPPPAQAAHLAHEGSLEQEDSVCQGYREGGCRVRSHPPHHTRTRAPEASKLTPLGYIQPRTVRAPRDRTPPQQQGQARAQACEEAARHIRACEEKGGRDDQGDCGEQADGSLEGYWRGGWMDCGGVQWRRRVQRGVLRACQLGIDTTCAEPTYC